MADKLISYAELVKAFDDCCGECGCCIHHLPDHSERNTHCLILNSLKAVDAEPVRHGRWERKEEWFDNGFTYITMVFHKCSECGFKTNWRDKLDDRHKTLYNYCPRCGAKMDAKEDEPCE